MAKHNKKTEESASDVDDSPLGTQSLLRGLSLLEHLSSFPNGCPLAKLVEVAGFSKSTTHRLLQGLQSVGYVTNAPTPGSYRLTTKCVEIGQRALSSLNVIHVAARHLEKLNIDTGETVNLSVREGDHAVLIYKLESTESMIRTRAYIGQHLPMYCSAMGKIFLAFDHKNRINDYWQRNKAHIIALTPRTIVTKTAMQKELTHVRQHHYALDREENSLGALCIAAPIFNIQQKIALAVSITLASTGLSDERMHALIARIQQTASDISHEIGGKATH